MAIVGQTYFIGSTQYLIINSNGTVEKLPELKWYWQLYVYFRQRTNPMGVAELREWVQNHYKRRNEK